MTGCPEGVPHLEGRVLSGLAGGHLRPSETHTQTAHARADYTDARTRTRRPHVRRLHMRAHATGSQSSHGRKQTRRLPCLRRRASLSCSGCREGGRVSSAVALCSKCATPSPQTLRSPREVPVPGRMADPGAPSRGCGARWGRGR